MSTLLHYLTAMSFVLIRVVYTEINLQHKFNLSNFLLIMHYLYLIALTLVHKLQPYIIPNEHTPFDPLGLTWISLYLLALTMGNAF